MIVSDYFDPENNFFKSRKAAHAKFDCYIGVYINQYTITDLKVYYNGKAYGTYFVCINHHTGKKENFFPMDFIFDNDLSNPDKMQLYRNTYVSIIEPDIENKDSKKIYCFSVYDWAEILEVIDDEVYEAIVEKRNGLSVKKALSKIYPHFKGSFRIKPNKIVEIPEKFLQYNRPDLYDQSIHD